jgi:SPP1 family predicted phage head-tail adaptor
MNHAYKITLLTSKYTQDAIGQWVKTVEETDVFGLVSSVTMSEFYQAGMQGFKPDFRITIWMTEYHDEEELVYNDKVYSIYRTYIRDDGRIELYVTERKGDEE